MIIENYKDWKPKDLGKANVSDEEREYYRKRVEEIKKEMKDNANKNK